MPGAKSLSVIAEMTSTRIDFEAVFHALPSPYMILDRALCYVEANVAYCAVVERRSEDLIGRNLFDLFPNPGPAGLRLRESLERVLSTGKTDSIPLIPYPIERPLSRGGGFEMRFWSAAHVPLAGPDGRIAYVMQNTVDVTVTSALPLTAEQAEKLTQALTRRLRRTVRLSSTVDPSLIGGAVVRAGDFVVDGSLRGRVERLGNTMAGA